jgi:hypothetical protein
MSAAQSRIRAVDLVFTRHARKRTFERGVRIDEVFGGDTIVVTLYEPDPERWEAGFVRRRQKP